MQIVNDAISFSVSEFYNINVTNITIYEKIKLVGYSKIVFKFLNV